MIFHRTRAIFTWPYYDSKRELELSPSRLELWLTWRSFHAGERPQVCKKCATAAADNRKNYTAYIRLEYCWVRTQNVWECWIHFWIKIQKFRFQKTLLTLFSWIWTFCVLLHKFFFVISYYNSQQIFIKFDFLKSGNFEGLVRKNTEKSWMKMTQLSSERVAYNLWLYVTRFEDLLQISLMVKERN